MIDPVIPRRSSNFDAGQTIPPPPPIDRYAEAITEVNAMRETIITQTEHINDLKRELQNERDRVTLLTEERARWRTEALACRTFVVKLATILEHVNTATVGAAAILDDMAKMDAEVTPGAMVEETKKFVEDNLTKLRRMDNGALVETMQEGS